MEYKVALTSRAKTQFRKIIDYLLYELENQQAAWSYVMTKDCGLRDTGRSILKAISI